VELRTVRDRLGEMKAMDSHSSGHYAMERIVASAKAASPDRGGESSMLQLAAPWRAGTELV
jgi:hypothetical protein